LLSGYGCGCLEGQGRETERYHSITTHF